MSKRPEEEASSEMGCAGLRAVLRLVGVSGDGSCGAFNHGAAKERTANGLCHGWRRE